MSDIKQWAFSVCMAMVACGIAQMLLPKSSMTKIFNITVSVFFLCCILSPFVLQNPEIRLQLEEYSQEDIARRAQLLTATVEEQSEDSVKATLTKIIREKLQEKGINSGDITIHIKANGQNGGEEILVEIVLEKEYEKMHSELRRDLTNLLGLEVRLGYE